MTREKSVAENSVVVMLAAGKGTRMGRSDMGKVCFDIDGVPAINGAIAAFKKERFRRFLLVVGTHSEQVVRTVHRDHPGVMFTLQEPQLGTGHAARVAADALQTMGFEGHVLVTMGDKYIETTAIAALLDGFVKQAADMALLTIPKAKATTDSSGRVFLDATGQALDIIEKTDLGRQAVADELAERLRRADRVSADDVRRALDRHLPNSAKQAVAAPELVELAAGVGLVSRSRLEHVLSLGHYHLTVGGHPYAARAIERLCKGVNPSLYLFRAPAFYEGVRLIDSRNAQREYYLTDIVRHLAARRNADGGATYRVRAVMLDDARAIQGFNSPDELLAIQDYVRRGKARERPAAAARAVHLSARQFRTAREWLARLRRDPASARRWCRRVYGEHEEGFREKAAAMRAVLECYAQRFGADERVCIVRAPGRVNLMGRHVDHRGGYNNFLAIDRETFAVVGARRDTSVVAVNTERDRYPPFEFNITEWVSHMAWDDWLNVVNSDWVRSLLAASAGNWGNYVTAAVLRLQHNYQDVRLPGMNMAVGGTVPIAAGLSSSSSLVVASLQALIALNGFNLTSQQFIDLCGEGEWFVGSRGGAGDHAAIYLGQRGKIAHVGYLPFRVERILDAPRGYRVVIADSHIKATKSAAAKSMFNSKVASYNLGLALFRQRCPDLAGVVEYVRDLDPAKLGCTTSELYRRLLKVPERMTRKELRAVLAKEHHSMMETAFATHTEPPHYDLRGVLLFGAAEIARSRICIDFLEQGRIEDFGRLMKVSHDGDRVSRPGPTGAYQRVAAGCPDEYIRRLIADLASEDPDRVLGAQLYMQPGDYACSMPEIDEMVDIACAVPGVAGAQIAGAGLGGCIMMLVRDDAVDAVRRSLIRRYYEPRHLAPAVMPCRATEGAGLVEF